MSATGYKYLIVLFVALGLLSQAMLSVSMPCDMGEHNQATSIQAHSEMDHSSHAMMDSDKQAPATMDCCDELGCSIIHCNLPVALIRTFDNAISITRQSAFEFQPLHYQSLKLLTLYRPPTSS